VTLPNIRRGFLRALIVLIAIWEAVIGWLAYSAIAADRTANIFAKMDGDYLPLSTELYRLAAWAIIPPLLCLAAFYVLVWVARGFASQPTSSR
jgi:H+/Cl- antiporter ClcA